MNGQTAVDSAAGGSGAHNGTYRVTTTESITPTGYDEKQSLRCSLSTSDGIIDSFANISDLQLTGTYSVMFWFMPRNAIGNGMYVFSVGGTTEDQAENILIHIEGRSTGAFRVFWEYGSGSNVDISSATGLISAIRWYHVAVIRYPIAANYGVKFYINGVLADTQDNGGTGYTAADGGTNGLGYIGRTPGDSSAFNYYNVDSIRVYDTDESPNVNVVYTLESPSFNYATPFVDVAPELVVDSRNTLAGFLQEDDPEIVVDSLESNYGGLALSGPTLALVETDRRNVGFYQ